MERLVIYIESGTHAIVCNFIWFLPHWEEETYIVVGAEVELVNRENVVI